MTLPPIPRCAGRAILSCIILAVLAVTIGAPLAGASEVPEPSLYLTLNEGSGQHAFDVSGNGNSGEIHGATRINEGACGNALFFNGVDSYVTIPFRSGNHPEDEITVDLWFSVDSFDRQVLVSTYNNGGYRIAFDDGNDLWWTVTTARGEVSVPVQHDSIALHRWHHLAGTYDGRVSRIYLDGILRNVANGTGPIRYATANDVLLGVDAGSTGSQPDPQCNGYYKGGIDEVRIYSRALTYGQVMDDRFSCPQEEPGVPEFTPSNRTFPAGCNGLSQSLSLSGNDPVTRRIIMTSPDQSALFNVQIPPGSTLYAGVTDAYGEMYPDMWYIEIAENGKRLTRSVAVPATYTTPADAVIPSGNATITIRYFGGTGRFPSSARVMFRSAAPPPLYIEPPVYPIFANPIIVIYTASWATLVAVILVFYLIHTRKKKNSG